MKNLVVLRPLRTLIFVVALDAVCFAFCLALDFALFFFHVESWRTVAFSSARETALLLQWETMKR